jgi:hypothetical protein
MNSKSGALAQVQELTHIGSTLRNATRFITKEPLPDGMQVMLLLLQLSEPPTAPPANLPHWTSDRDPEQS